MSMTSHLLAIAAGVAGVTLYQRARQSGALSGGTGAGSSVGGSNRRIGAGGDSAASGQSDSMPSGMASGGGRFDGSASGASRTGVSGMPELATGA